MCKKYNVLKLKLNKYKYKYNVMRFYLILAEWQKYYKNDC